MPLGDWKEATLMRAGDDGQVRENKISLFSSSSTRSLLFLFFYFILLLLSMESLLRGISSFFLCAIKLTRDFHGGVQELLNLTNAFAREVELSM